VKSGCATAATDGEAGTDALRECSFKLFQNRPGREPPAAQNIDHGRHIVVVNLVTPIGEEGWVSLGQG
jgi:hypothetical protein